MAEENISIYTTRKKQERKEGERKGRKGRKKESGGATHPYPARKRRIRTCRDGKGRSDRIAVGVGMFPPVRLRMTPVDGLDFLRG
jgi:hypothetical protein